MTLFEQHIERWKECQACLLHSCRTQVVFAKGSVPCDVLFIGEAPGMSEDSLGLPFVGPAGKLLDTIVGRAFYSFKDLRYAFTNAVACYPREQKETDNHAPPKEAIRACKKRLVEFIRIAQPRLIVLVGATAKRSVVGQSDFCERGEDDQPPWIPYGKFVQFAEIVHPAAILRGPLAQRSLAMQRCVIVLANALSKLVEEWK